jgi:hypothetical protein
LKQVDSIFIKKKFLCETFIESLQSSSATEFSAYKKQFNQSLQTTSGLNNISNVIGFYSEVLFDYYLFIFAGNIALEARTNFCLAILEKFKPVIFD